MFLDNKMISGRQSFRIGILENITLGMVVIPYITLNMAGRWHFVAFILGLIFGGIYMTIIYFLSKAMPEDMVAKMEKSGFLGRGVCLLYTIRFVIRAGVILLFFGKTMQEFLLQSFNLWVIVIVFVVVCGYGASRDIEKRGRMLELLFPWMIVPIILVAAFSISNISLEDISNGLMGVNYNQLHEGAGALDVLKAGYVAFLIITSWELMLFTLPSQRENNWRNALKTGIWILISIFLAYIFIIGILGGHWVASDSQAALNVMEAAFIPGGIVERADYPVLAFWVIGVFAIVTGYMFYAKEAFLVGTRLKAKKQSSWGIWIIMALIILMVWLWSQTPSSIYLSEYMLWVDVIISLIVPIVGLIWKGPKGILKLGKKNGTVMATIIVMGCIFLTGCSNDEFNPLSREQASIEDRDYVTKITFQGEKDIIFTVADIKKYISDATGSFDTKEEKLSGENIKLVMEEYYDANGRQLDVGHLDGITFKDVSWDRIREYAVQMSNMSQLGKSINVTIDGENKIELSLRDLIKMSYAGEDFP